MSTATPFSGRVEEYLDPTGTIHVTRCIETGEARYEPVDAAEKPAGETPNTGDNPEAQGVALPWPDIADLGVRAIQERLADDPSVAAAVLDWENAQDKPRQTVVDAATKALPPVDDDGDQDTAGADDDGQEPAEAGNEDAGA